MSEMQKFQCTVHNIKFGAQLLKGRFVSCPYCEQDKLAQMREKLIVAEEHRASLLRAIEIKQTMESRLE